MSRIGKMPITVPAGVEITVAEGNVVTVKGPKGTLTRAFHPNMKITVDGAVATVARPNDEKANKSLHGLSRTLLNNMVIGVTAGLAFLAANDLSGIFDALALVRLGGPLAADFCCHLADLLVVDAGDNDLVSGGSFQLNILGLFNHNGVREAQVHDQVLTLLGATITNTVAFQFLLVLLVDADDHVVQQSTGQTVQGAVLLQVVGTGDSDHAVVHGDGHVGAELLLQGALSALDGDNVVVSDANLHTSGDGDRSSTDTTHS